MNRPGATATSNYGWDSLVIRIAPPWLPNSKLPSIKLSSTRVPV